MNSIRFVLAALVLAFASTAQAEELLIGHFAGGVDSINIEINGVQVAQGVEHLGVVSVDQELGDLTISARSVSSGEEVATLEVEFKSPLMPMQPMLMLVNTGPQGALQLWLHQDSALLENVPPAANATLISMVNASAVESTDDYTVGFQFQYDLRCAGPNSSSGSSASRPGLLQLRPEDSRTASIPAAVKPCRLQLSLIGAGAFEVVDAPARPDETLRFLIVGDGEYRPFQLVTVAGRELYAATSGFEVEPGPILQSNQVWFDRSRPAQGVALFEMPGAGLMHGTWHTFKANGEAVWYLLDGTARSLPGDRDITIFAVDREDGLNVTPAGTGRLTYFNCNEAEARFELSGEPVMFLRLERSEPVEQCYALE